jgi:hypothetical protein
VKRRLPKLQNDSLRRVNRTLRPDGDRQILSASWLLLSEGDGLWKKVSATYAKYSGKVHSLSPNALFQFI